MQSFLNTPLTIGTLTLANRLIQGPLAGFSCAAFRRLFYRFVPPAYCVSEMMSAHDVVYKHHFSSRYLFRAPEETHLCYQLAGNDPALMAEAAAKLAALAPDLLDINCGCPKAKIRKKGAGSALLQQPDTLKAIVRAVKDVSPCPLTVKIRIQGNDQDFMLAEQLAEAGADALIVHGRRWVDDYAIACDFKQIARIKRHIGIPVIANGDIHDLASLHNARLETGCDAFMISRAGTGKPWLYQQLLQQPTLRADTEQASELFLLHLTYLSEQDTEYQAVLQSKSLIRYYFKNRLTPSDLSSFYALTSLAAIKDYMRQWCLSQAATTVDI
ncbi:tRNA-dihydrouridine synthase family protein [Legionella taurinensis]|uniref:tRNA-dihydrouridine synthase n=1 Tax=Legionella taurinensis TaxID=70611 RepID=A0A3A5L641_9GAMM|nr:tRNA-dihydrouridine synthase family protein [Legionella taurinensis]MDX1836348.1 tRNA-dihydrouridine synthase family protein [Legionella taurinensis]PUT41902.1 nitrogen regulation protein [Legionella taurinensis]PUT44691.1 nitrogen regulation protein [Legionella taurinensis]PUT48011.1 nitrogen regulation protein [Legionella taurinensis]PUT48824.1 nitrogen regulation protein [Legionella taurinensis]